MSMITPILDIMLSKQVLHFVSLHMTPEAVGTLKLGINSPGFQGKAQLSRMGYPWLTCANNTAAVDELC